MNFNNIIEKRTVENGLHNLVLEISKEEYNNSYDKYDNEIASQILKQHLINRDDDGRPSNVEIQHDNNNNLIKIHANIHYLGNDHTQYDKS